MIIGLAGAAGAGKNTVAERLLVAHQCVPLAFANPLYEAVSVITGLTVDELQDRTQKERALGWISCSPRRLLQTLGTDWGRQMIHPEIWVMSTMRRIEAHPEFNYCLTDVRFENEAEAIKARGGVVWRVTRAADAGLDATAAAHSSEAGIPDKYVDLDLANDGSVESLWRAVDAAIGSLQAATMAG